MYIFRCKKSLVLEPSWAVIAKSLNPCGGNSYLHILCIGEAVTKDPGALQS